nr:transposase [uncultured Oscillibacter sp.]
MADDAEYKDLYAKRKVTIERVFADAKGKYGVRYTFYRGLAQVSKWVRLEFVTMNLKKLAKWKAKRQRSALFPPLSIYLSILHFAACLLFFGQAVF